MVSNNHYVLIGGRCDWSWEKQWPPLYNSDLSSNIYLKSRFEQVSLWSSLVMIKSRFDQVLLWLGLNASRMWAWLVILTGSCRDTSCQEWAWEVLWGLFRLLLICWQEIYMSEALNWHVQDDEGRGCWAKDDLK